MNSLDETTILHFGVEVVGIVKHIVHKVLKVCEKSNDSVDLANTQ